MRRMRLWEIGLAVTASCLHLQAVPLAHSLSRHLAPGAATVVAVLEEPLPLANHAQASAATSNPSATDAQRALLKRYCITCHNEELKTAGLMLDRLDVERVGEGAETWEKVVRKLRSRAMPPAGRPRPDKTSYDRFGTWLETELDRAAEARPNPGRPVVRRLNRLEYTNTIRDLLALEVDGRALLPTDESGYGFDNIGDVLAFSPGLLERYMNAARKISRLALADPTIGPSIDRYKVSPFIVQTGRVSDDLPFGSRGGVAIRHNFPADGEYVLRIRLGRRFDNDAVQGLGSTRERLDVRIDAAGSRFSRWGASVWVRRSRGASSRRASCQYPSTSERRMSRCTCASRPRRGGGSSAGRFYEDLRVGRFDALLVHEGEEMRRGRPKSKGERLSGHRNDVTSRGHFGLSAGGI